MPARTRNRLVPALASAALLTAGLSTLPPGAPALAAAPAAPDAALAGHPVMVDAGDAAAADALRAAGASRIAGYRSFSVWSVPEARADDVLAVAGVDDAAALEQIVLRDRVLDTSGSVPAPSRLAGSPAGADGGQLRLVQFAAPVKPAWVAALTSAGARIVDYLPSNAYLVWTDDPASLTGSVATAAPVRWSGAFHPAYRLSPALQGKQAPDGVVSVDITAVDNAQGRTDLAGLAARYPAARAGSASLGQRTVTLRVPAADLGDVASLPAVVDVQRYVAPRLNDERQDMLLAGQYAVAGSTTVPTGPGYLDWLDTHQFPTDPDQYPVVTVIDDGVDNGTATPLHPDFYQLGSLSNPDRLLVNGNCTPDASGNGQAGHGNLNAGIVGGYNGQDDAAHEDAAGYQYGLGVSPYGRLSSLKIFRNTGAYDLSACGSTVSGVIQRAYDQGAGLTTNSWGANVGGAYTVDAREFDRLTRDASATDAGNQQMLHIFSAGNAGSSANTLGSPGTAKNVLTVGATENVREQGFADGCAVDYADSDSDIATFSSRGPTDDGRIKPDVVAAGTHVQGPASQDPAYDGTGVCADPADKYHPAGQTLYTWSSGTSHSTPAVAGVASLAQEFYGRVLDPGATASPAMLKALIVNGTRYLDGVGSGDSLPSNAQGYGVPDMSDSFSTVATEVVDQTQLFTASGQEFSKTGTVASAGQPVRITLAWTDAPGATTGAAYVNDLDLEVTLGGVTYLGNHFTDGLSTAGGTADPRDNVESVVLPAVPGNTGPIQVRVVARTIAGDGVPGNDSALDQDFALIAKNVTYEPAPVPVLTSATVTDSSFDGNDTLDPGEPLILEQGLRNDGDLATQPGDLTLQVVSGPATVDHASTPVPAVAPGETESGEESLSLHLDESASCASTVVLRTTWTDGALVRSKDTEILVGTLPHASGTQIVRSTATDTPKAIPDNNATGISSTVLVPGDAADKVGALGLELTATHTWDGDLVATLTSPSGTTRRLFERNGGVNNSGDNFTSTYFEDTAATSITAGMPPYTGSFRPLDTLAPFYGEPLAGPWTLTVSDRATADVGSIQSWSLDTDTLVTDPCVVPGPTVEIAVPDAVDEDAGTLDVAVTLLRPDGAAHSVDLESADLTALAPGDFEHVTQTLTWAPGDPATQTFSVPVHADFEAEDTEDLLVRATASDVPVTAPVRVGLHDAPAPDVHVSVADAGAAAEGSSLAFPVTIGDRDPSATYTVDLKVTGGTADAADYTGGLTTLTWAPGDPATQEVALPLVADGVDELDETVEMTLASPSTTAGVLVIDGSPASGTVLDADTVTASVATARTREGDRGTRRKLVFVVSLSAPAAQDVVLDWSTADKSARAGADYVAGSGTVTIPAGATSARVKVKVKGDRRAERTEKMRFVGGAIGGAAWLRSSAVGTILDDD